MLKLGTILFDALFAAFFGFIVSIFLFIILLIAGVLPFKRSAFLLLWLAVGIVVFIGFRAMLTLLRERELRQDEIPVFTPQEGERIELALKNVGSRSWGILSIGGGPAMTIFTDRRLIMLQGFYAKKIMSFNSYYYRKSDFNQASKIHLGWDMLITRCTEGESEVKLAVIINFMPSYLTLYTSHAREIAQIINANRGP